MPRFSDTVHADATLEQSWETLQDAGVWGALLGAAEIGDIEVAEGLLESCSWTAKIGGTNLKGTMTVEESRPLEYMDVMVQAEEWRCRIEMLLEAEGPQTRADPLESQPHCGRLHCHIRATGRQQGHRAVLPATHARARRIDGTVATVGFGYPLTPPCVSPVTM